MIRAVRMARVVAAMGLTACTSPTTTSSAAIAPPGRTQAQSAFERAVQAEAAGSSLNQRRLALDYYRAAAGPQSLDVFVPAGEAGRPTARRVVVSRNETYWAARAAAVRLQIEANGDLGPVLQACREARKIVAAPTSGEEVARLRRLWTNACPHENGVE